MKNTPSTMVFLSTLNVIICLVLNFQEFLMGNPATLKNVAVTLTYLIFWILIMKRSIEFKNRKIKWYFIIFWLLNLFEILIAIYANTTSAQVDWALPLALLLLGQWYGINYFVGSYLSSTIIVIVICLAMLSVMAVSLKRTE